MTHPTDPRALVEQLVGVINHDGHQLGCKVHAFSDKCTCGLDETINATLTAATEYLKQPQGKESDAELLLRELASHLGVGGYNAPTVDVKVFREKLYDGIRVYGTLHGIAARDLAEQVLHMELATERGLRACESARRVLGLLDLSHHQASEPAPSPDVYLSRAYEVVGRAVGEGLDLNITRLHDLLSKESGSQLWPDSAFFEEPAPSTAGEIPDEVVRSALHATGDGPFGKDDYDEMRTSLKAAFLGMQQVADRIAQPAQGELCTNCAADGKCMKRQALCHANGTAKQGKRAEAASSLRYEWKYYAENEGANGGSLSRAIERAAALLSAPALPVGELTTCNCRWNGEEQVQSCTLHQAHVDAIHEWAERAKTAERELAAARTQPERVPMTDFEAGYASALSDVDSRPVIKADMQIGFLERKGVGEYQVRLFKNQGITKKGEQ